jgi:hypothetical protein
MRRVAVAIAVSLAVLGAPASVSAARVSFERLPGFHAPGTPTSGISLQAEIRAGGTTPAS